MQSYFFKLNTTLFEFSDTFIILHKKSIKSYNVVVHTSSYTIIEKHTMLMSCIKAYEKRLVIFKHIDFNQYQKLMWWIQFTDTIVSCMRLK